MLCGAILLHGDRHLHDQRLPRLAEAHVGQSLKFPRLIGLTYISFLVLVTFSQSMKIECLKLKAQRLDLDRLKVGQNNIVTKTRVNDLIIQQNIHRCDYGNGHANIKEFGPKNKRPRSS